MYILSQSGPLSVLFKCRPSQPGPQVFVSLFLAALVHARLLSVKQYRSPLFRPILVFRCAAVVLCLAARVLILEGIAPSPNRCRTEILAEVMKKKVTKEARHGLRALRVSCFLAKAVVYSILQTPRRVPRRPSALLLSRDVPPSWRPCRLPISRERYSAEQSLLSLVSRRHLSSISHCSLCKCSSFRAVAPL